MDQFKIQGVEATVEGSEETSSVLGGCAYGSKRTRSTVKKRSVRDPKTIIGVGQNPYCQSKESTLEGFIC